MLLKLLPLIWNAVWDDFQMCCSDHCAVTQLKCWGIWTVTPVMATRAHDKDYFYSFTKTFFSHFKRDGKFILLSPKFWQSDHYKISHMTRQLCCRGMCEILLRSGDQWLNYSKAKFPLNLNCEKNTVSETGPSTYHNHLLVKIGTYDNGWILSTFKSAYMIMTAS